MSTDKNSKFYLPTGFDNDVYDAPPEGKDLKEYGKGFLTILYVSYEPAIVKYIPIAIAKSNAYAYITSKYEITEDAAAPYTIAYVIHKRMYEKLVFDWICIHPKWSRPAIPIDASHKEPVWFHKGWISPTFDPKKYELTPGRRFFLLNSMLEGASRNYKKKIKVELMRERGCYEPIKGKNLTCKGGNVNPQICAKCVLYKGYDRYDNGKCIDPVRPRKNKTKK